MKDKKDKKDKKDYKYPNFYSGKILNKHLI